MPGLNLCLFCEYVVFNVCVVYDTIKSKSSLCPVMCKYSLDQASVVEEVKIKVAVPQ